MVSRGRLWAVFLTLVGLGMLGQLLLLLGFQDVNGVDAPRSSVTVVAVPPNSHFSRALPPLLLENVVVMMAPPTGAQDACSLHLGFDTCHDLLMNLTQTPLKSLAPEDLACNCEATREPLTVPYTFGFSDLDREDRFFGSKVVLTFGCGARTHRPTVKVDGFFVVVHTVGGYSARSLAHLSASLVDYIISLVKKVGDQSLPPNRPQVLLIPPLSEKDLRSITEWNSQGKVDFVATPIPGSELLFSSLLVIPQEFFASLVREDTQWARFDPGLITSLKLTQLSAVVIDGQDNVARIDREARKNVAVYLRDPAILNERAILTAMQEHFGVIEVIVIVREEDLPLFLPREVVVVVGTTRSLLLAATLVPEGSLLIELFPWQYRSLLVENVAIALHLNHFAWQATTPPRDVRLTYPLPWHSPTLLAPWRSRQFAVNVRELVDLFFRAGRRKARPTFIAPALYLLHQPWEQANNQLIGFRSACAIAKLLDRVLVLPFFGERTEVRGDWNYTFSVGDFTWKPLEAYFNQSALALLPCDTISFSQFQVITGLSSRPIPRAFFNPLFRHTKQQQQRDYYERVLHLKISDWKQERRHYQSDAAEILRLYSAIRDDVLPLGVTFWGYDFGQKFTYPFTEYHNPLSDPAYLSIVRAIRFRDDILQLGEALARQVQPDLDFTAIHCDSPFLYGGLR